MAGLTSKFSSVRSVHLDGVEPQMFVGLASILRAMASVQELLLEFQGCPFLLKRPSVASCPDSSKVFPSIRTLIVVFGGDTSAPCFISGLLTWFPALAQLQLVPHLELSNSYHYWLDSSIFFWNFAAHLGPSVNILQTLHLRAIACDEIFRTSFRALANLRHLVLDLHAGQYWIQAIQHMHWPPRLEHLTLEAWDGVPGWQDQARRQMGQLVPCVLISHMRFAAALRVFRLFSSGGNFSGRVSAAEITQWSEKCSNLGVDFQPCDVQEIGSEL